MFFKNVQTKEIYLVDIYLVDILGRNLLTPLDCKHLEDRNHLLFDLNSRFPEKFLRRYRGYIIKVVKEEMNHNSYFFVTNFTH